MKNVGQRYRHLRRYQVVAQVLARHGFGGLVEQLGLAQYLTLPRRFFRREPPPALTALTAPQRVRLAIQELGPTFIKLAQVLSTRPDLIPPPYLAELARLQDEVPPAPWPCVRARIEDELGGPLEEVFADLKVEPVAAASLGQVHRATLPRPSARAPALLLAAAVLLVLQIAAILLVAGHVAIPSLITGWLLAVTVVCLILRWPRLQ